LEGIIPALESAHAIAHVMRVAPKLAADKLVVLDFRAGDKDVFTVANALAASCEPHRRALPPSFGRSIAPGSFVHHGR